MNKFLSNLRVLEVMIPCGDVTLEGDVEIPAGASGLVVFAHGSGSSRLSPRNRLVAAEMHRKGLATMLFDLLTPHEARVDARSGALRFDIEFLTARLVAVTRWVGEDEELRKLGIGYFGSSTGAAAALAAAAEMDEVQAVVSRGGRTDLAGDAVGRVTAATLLIVGERDEPVLEWNRQTLQRLAGLKHLSVVPGASHLFEEPGALEHVAELASGWFDVHLAKQNS